MTLEEIRAAVDTLRDLVGAPDFEWSDDEAHALEDEIRKQFIQYVASQPGELGETARVVLSTGELDFARWYS